jgi:hypothetical protein
MPVAIWAAAEIHGWSEIAAMHYCPTCTRTRGQGRLAATAAL